MAQLCLNNDGTLTLTGWRLGTAGAYLNAATVTWAIYGPTGAAVSGATGTLAYTAASNGVYSGTVESTAFAALAEGDAYRIAVTAVQGSTNAEFNLTGVVQRRGAA